MATHSSKASDSRKPTKPYDDFPLTPRADGRWCKRINGKLELFIGDWKDAFDEYDRCKAALYAGLPRGSGQNGPGVFLRFLANSLSI